MKLVVCGVVLALLFAGCTDEPENAAFGPGDTIDEDGNPIAPEGAEVGHVAGTVTTDVGVALKGADVLLVGSSRLTQTDDQGAFRFANVTVGNYLVRVEARSYQAWEREVKIEVDQTIEVEAVMIPADDRGAGYRPHVHDYWGSQTEIQIADVTVDIAESRVGSTTADMHPLLNTASATILYANTVYGGLRYVIPVESPDGGARLVYPGTASIEVTLTWDDAPPYPDRYAVSYTPASDNDEVILDAQGPGSTWTIDVTPDMTDNSHQLFSLWEFYIRPVNDVQNPTGGYRPAYGDHEVQATITVFKGSDPAAEPGHPEFWVNGTEILLATHDETSRSKTPPPPIPSKVSWRLTNDEQPIVPPGTGTLTVELLWTYDDAIAGVDDAGYELRWNPADQNPLDRPYSEYATAEAAVSEPGRKVYEIQLEPSQTDGFYQTKSAWRFMAHSTGADADGFEPDMIRARTLSIEVTAIKDPGRDIA